MYKRTQRPPTLFLKVQSLPCSSTSPANSVQSLKMTSLAIPINGFKQSGENFRAKKYE